MKKIWGMTRDESQGYHHEVATRLFLCACPGKSPRLSSAKLLFQCRHALEQFGQFSERDKLAFGVLVWLRGIAEPLFAVGNVVHYAGLRGDGDLIADFQM